MPTPKLGRIGRSRLSDGAAIAPRRPHYQPSGAPNADLCIFDKARDGNSQHVGEGLREMRIMGLVLSLLATLSLAAWALTYVPGYLRQPIYVQGRSGSSLDHQPYHSYGHSRHANPGTAETVTGDLDPYHQRYYSESEGWTYYTLPSKDSGQVSGDK
jgi:hypothetical protein